MDENKDNVGSKSKRKILFIIGTILVFIAFLSSWWMIKNRPTAKRRKPPSLIPKVQVEELKSVDVHVKISAMGIVIPSQEAALRARVSGEVYKMHEELEPGGIIKKGEPIIWIDDDDYKLQLKVKQARLKKIESELLLELVQQRIAKSQFETYGDKGKSEKLDMDMILRKPQERSIKADLMAAEADIKYAELNLSRTIMKAPFNAVVLERDVDIGEQADLQRILAILVDIDTYWVQVSISVKDLKWIRFPKNGKKGSLVEIKCRRGIREGRVRRLMSNLDTKGRMAKILVEVVDPLDLQNKSDNPTPMLLKEYVHVSILGKVIKNVVKISRKAYHDNRSIWLMTPKNRLEVLDIAPIWDIRNAIYVYSKELPPGKLITSDLGFPIKGMTLSSVKKARTKDVQLNKQACLQIEQASLLINPTGGVKRKGDKRK